MFVGEIGIPRKEFLYDICFWEARRILRGYRNRYRDMWSALRWHAYRIMGAMPYVDLPKSGIHRPTDLIKFPWDNETVQVTEADAPTEEDVEEMKELLRTMKEGSDTPNTHNR